MTFDVYECTEMTFVFAFPTYPSSPALYTFIMEKKEKKELYISSERYICIYI